MLQHVLTVDGFEVLRVDEAPWQELVRLVEDSSDLRVVGISLHQSVQPTMLTNGIRAVRRARPGVRVVLGGLAVRRDAGLAARVRAHAGAGDLAQARLVMRSLVNPSPSERSPSWTPLRRAVRTRPSPTAWASRSAASSETWSASWSRPAPPTAPLRSQPRCVGGG